MQVIKKSERTVPLREYLTNLRTKDEIISKQWKLKQKEKKTIKDIMDEEFIEHCNYLGLSNRNIAYVLNCSAGTVGSYMSSYNSLKMDDILYKELDLTNDILQYAKSEYNFKGQKYIENVFLMISDIQAGALITAEGYDSTPAKTVEIYFERLLEQIREVIYNRNITIGNFNIMLLGDLVDGWKVFPHQLTTPIYMQHEVVVKNILKLIKEVTQYANNVNVYGVFGNHGRVSSWYPSEDNWDNVAMREIKTHINYLKDLDESFENVTSYLSTKETQKHKIGEFTYFITHGHQISSFSVESWKRAMTEWHIAQNGFDCLLMGHWHQMTWVSNVGKDLLVNGCMYRSEYVQNKLRGKEDICQLMFASSDTDPVVWVEKLDIDQGVYIIDQ